MIQVWKLSLFFFFNDTATTEIYTLSLHDALPILGETRLKAPKIGGLGADFQTSKSLFISYEKLN